MDPSELSRAVETVVRRCLDVRPGEHVVIVADSTTTDLGVALRDEAEAAGADATLTLVTPRAVDGEDPSPPVAAALAACDVFIAPTSWSISHTPARRAATTAGARGATMPHVTTDLLARLMAADFDALAARSRALAERLDAADEAQLTCPRGTDFAFDLRGRDGIVDDGDLTSAGAFGNLPCGEAFIAPAGGEGTLVVSSLARIGLADPPARLTVAGGRLTDAEGPAGEALLERLRGAGELGTNLAELGIGTNERAGLTGNILEDEKMLGTAHIAFGASAGIGGTVSVPVHLDCLVLDATLTIGGETVVDGGRVVV
jgi:leucyl aminopeptidase (aminopeptidase T)